jgi:hypothetical protein
MLDPRLIGGLTATSTPARVLQNKILSGLMAEDNNPSANFQTSASHSPSRGMAPSAAATLESHRD